MRAAVCLSVGLGLASFADAATAFWAFQEATASGSATRLTPNVVSGFLSTPTISKIIGNTTSANAGGQSSFSYEGTTYLGTGGGTGTDNSFGWNAQGTQNFTGSGFTLGLNLTGLTDLSVAFSMRAAVITGGTTPSTAFKLVEYSLNGTDWTTISSGLYPTWTVGSYVRRTIDLTGIDAIEGESSVQLRFLFADTANSVEASSLRIDNLVLTAVPEPAAAGLGIFGLLGGMLRRRR